MVVKNQKIEVYTSMILILLYLGIISAGGIAWFHKSDLKVRDDTALFSTSYGYLQL